MQDINALQRPTIVLVASLVLASLAACGDIEALPETRDAPFAYAAAVAPTVDPRGDDASIIAEIELEDGGLIRFIDEDAGVEDGTVGILEFTALDAAPVAASFAEEQVTPLELFRAVAPDRQAPDRLVAHHRAMALLSSVVEHEPRSLSLATAPVKVHDGGVVWSWCSNSSVFNTSYRTMLHNPNGFAHFGFGGNLWGTNYGVTAPATRRALSVCNHPNANSNTGVSVWRQIGQHHWVYVPGTSYDMVPHRGMWYASQDPSFALPTRYRVYASGGYYSIAGSWGQQ